MIYHDSKSSFKNWFSINQPAPTLIGPRFTLSQNGYIHPDSQKDNVFLTVQGQWPFSPLPHNAQR
jgi:hypothetical protein